MRLIVKYCCPVKVATLAATFSNTVIYSPLAERGLGGGGKKKIFLLGLWLAPRNRAQGSEQRRVGEARAANSEPPLNGGLRPQNNNALSIR